MPAQHLEKMYYFSLQKDTVVMLCIRYVDSLEIPFLFLGLD